MRVVIVGGGIAGLGTAWELAKRGLEVRVLERDHVGAGATSAAAGMLAAVSEAKYGEDGLVRQCLASRDAWPQWAAELEAASGVDVDYRTEGTFVVAVDRDDLKKLEHLQQLHHRLDLPATMIDGDEARELEPLLAPSIPGVLHCPNDHQVDPRLVIAALATAVRRAGVVIEEEVDVDDFEIVEGRVRRAAHVEDSDATYVLAAGAWSRQFPSLGADRPMVRPVRGQLLAVELGEPPLCRHVIRGPDAYLVPKSSGRLIVGATMEEVGFDPRLTAGGVMDILVGAWETIPAIYDQPILETWTGFRPLSLDAEPIIRRTDVASNLVLNTGHGRNGILLAPYTSRRAAALVLGE